MINWKEDHITGGAVGDILEGMIHITIVPSRHVSDPKLVGRYEIIIGHRYWSRDRLSEKGDDSYFYRDLQEAVRGCEGLMKRTVAHLAAKMKVFA